MGGLHAKMSITHPRLWAACCVAVSVLTLGTYELGRAASDAPAPDEVSLSPHASPSSSTTSAAPSVSSSPTASVTSSGHKVTATGSVPAVKKPVAVPSKTAASPPPRPKPKPTPVVHRTPSPPPQSSKSEAVVSFVEARVGDPYIWGAVGPYGYDCSGLVLSAFSSVGVDLPRTANEQSQRGVRVALSALQPGDVLFWADNSGFVFHDAVYVGGGYFVAAENSRTGVIRMSLSSYMPSFARRIL